MGVEKFLNLYKAFPIANLVEIIRVVHLFPWFVDIEDEDNLMRPITIQELWDTLKWFQRDKIQGPDGWPIEFYLPFFEIPDHDILIIVE